MDDKIMTLEEYKKESFKEWLSGVGFWIGVVVVWACVCIVSIQNHRYDLLLIEKIVTFLVYFAPFSITAMFFVDLNHPTPKDIKHETFRFLKEYDKYVEKRKAEIKDEEEDEEWRQQEYERLVNKYKHGGTK